MKRLLSAISALAFAASLGTSAFAADKMMKGDSMMMSGMKCKKGEKYVKGYTKKDKTKVKGYCRKG